MSEEAKNKKKFPLWMYPETRELVADWYRRDNCQSQSEFIEKAVRFYMGYLGTEDTSEYLSDALVASDDDAPPTAPAAARSAPVRRGRGGRRSARAS